MRNAIFLTFTLGLSLAVNANPLTFDEAKSLADINEDSLHSEKLTELISTQAMFAGIAFPYCIESTNTLPSDFTVVVELGPEGYVSKSWRLGSSPFAECFQELMELEFRVWPVIQPFYTSFEYTHEP